MWDYKTGFFYIKYQILILFLITNKIFINKYIYIYINIYIYIDIYIDIIIYIYIMFISVTCNNSVKKHSYDWRKGGEKRNGAYIWTI